ncbi:phosphotransferase family protein, partial [Actinokineospora sp.]|uniref:phosphotransferase family protein n=1 Tax=Actinokineospora sp. TaxID=1872133 RepID=UPI003D6BB0B4
TLAEVVDHGGFTGHDALADEIGKLVVLNSDGVIPRQVLDGLREIADRAPSHASATVPIHADCHWGNWLAHDRRVTALLDFEWARFGDPIDDWFFLARFSGPHLAAVLDVIARATATPSETLRAECEIREAVYLSSDLRAALEHSGPHAPMAVERLRNLDELIVERLWWGNVQ